MSRKVNYRVFFHNDMDGIITAASFIYNFIRDNKYKLYPVKSSSRGEKFNKMIADLSNETTDQIVILDYQYCDKADFWIDHHYDKKFGDKPVFNENILYDPTAKSAVRVLCNNMFGWNLLICPGVININDIIDNADYPNIEWIFENTEPLMVLRAYLDIMTPLNIIYSRIVETIVSSKFDFEKALFQLDLDSSIVEKLKERALSIKTSMVISKDISIVHQNRIDQYPRYSEFLVKPDLKYFLRFSRLGGNRIKASIGYNKWCDKPNDINIGEMISPIAYLINGGGHFNVGSATLYQNDVERFVDEISVQLNKEEVDEMEKYGVDSKEDKVEKKAQEMVKTGQSNNIDQAREKATSEEGDNKEDVSRGEKQL